MNIISLLKKYDIHPKKSLGQNFLVATPTLEKIIRTLRASPNDKVLEIGPGPGAMTRLLTDEAKFVAAVETDKVMVNLLETEWGKIPNLHIIHGNILDTNLDKLLGDSEPWLFIGNIPYNITSPLIFHIRKFRRHFRHGVLTMQKEVAERIVAGPGSKNYGILSIALQAIAKVENCFTISPSSFFPEPKVDSAVVRISFEDAPSYDISDLDFFTTVVRAAFSTRRKKVGNALAQSRLLEISSKDIALALTKAQIPENSRAEELSIDTFALLAKALK